MCETRIISSPEEAADILGRGGLVAIPTETVYGLAGRADDAAVVSRIFKAKDRPADNPLIVHVADLRQVEGYAARIPDYAHTLMAAFWPGPLTLVLSARESVPDIVTAGLGTVGVRMPDHDLTLSVIRTLAIPVAAPSANRSGRPSPTTWQAVQDDLSGRIEAILKSKPTPVGLESTVVDCTGDQAVVLRPGGVTLPALRAVLPDTRMAGIHDASERSPGTRHRHYRPESDVCWVGPFTDSADHERPSRDASVQMAYIGLNPPPSSIPFAKILCVPSIETYAHELFRFFRTCESEGIDLICCERISRDGLGEALADRINRAAGANE